MSETTAGSRFSRGLPGVWAYEGKFSIVLALHTHVETLWGCPFEDGVITVEDGYVHRMGGVVEAFTVVRSHLRHLELNMATIEKICDAQGDPLWVNEELQKSA